jgi:hypothetical protein
MDKLKRFGWVVICIIAYGLTVNYLILPAEGELHALSLSEQIYLGGQAPQSELPDIWYGIRKVPTSDLPFVADNLGGSVVELVVQNQTASEINTILDEIDAMGYQALLNLYTRTTTTRRPWDWDGSAWILPESTIEVLAGVSNHQALFAIYALHEPLDEDGAYILVDQQRELYQLLKQYTGGLPVFTDIARLSVWEDRGVILSDGICDYCCTFPSHFRADWTSERCIEETLSRIDDDLDTQQRLMPNSTVIALINTYALANYYYPIRMITLGELTIVRDHLCELGQSMMYYPWTHSLYDETLEDVEYLWPGVIAGCSQLYLDNRAFLPVVLEE